jgi:DNA-binding transcriptional ArsR family regulator
MSTSRKHEREVGPRLARHTRRHPSAASTHLTELGIDVVATRLRTLGHPTRLRILRALDGRPRTLDRLVSDVGEPDAAIHAHLAVLFRAGIVRRLEDEERPVYELADWPSLWVVDHLAFRLRQRVFEDAADGEERSA